MKKISLESRNSGKLCDLFPRAGFYGRQGVRFFFLVFTFLFFFFRIPYFSKTTEKIAQKNYEQCFAVNLWITYKNKANQARKTKKRPKIRSEPFNCYSADNVSYSVSQNTLTIKGIFIRPVCGHITWAVGGCNNGVG